MKGPHVLVIPYPAQGHTIPFMEFSHCLMDHGFRITFVNTEFNHARVMAALPTMDGVHGQMRLVAIPDGMAAGEDRNDIGKLCDSILETMPRALEELIGRINESREDKITCVVTDASMAWAAEVARKMGIPAAGFWAASVGMLASILGIPKMIQDGVIDTNGKPKTHQMIKFSPTMPAMDTTHLLWLCVDNPSSQQSIFRFSSLINQDLKSVDWLLCNSFYEIEKAACELIENILPIGPLIAGRRHGRLEGNFWQEDSSCLSWLDKQPACSVIYVAFGSFTVFNQHQFQELAIGLELSGKRFLWVVRPDPADGSKDPYPDGFKDTVGDRGLIIGWSPQQKVLAHPAIACFFTHCGWNSTIEGLSSGVPFLCWPYFTDQFFNKAYITDVWKVGLELKPDANGIMSREEIKEKLDELLGDKQIRARSLELKAMAEKNVSEGGSSLKNFNAFIEAMKLEKC